MGGYHNGIKQECACGLDSTAASSNNRIIDSFAFNYESAITSRGLSYLKSEIRYCLLNVGSEDLGTFFL